MFCSFCISCNDGLTGGEGASESKVANPPMIHSLAVAPSVDCPAAQIVAAACGDGTIAAWDMDKVTMLPLRLYIAFKWYDCNGAADSFSSEASAWIRVHMLPSQSGFVLVD